MSSFIILASGGAGDPMDRRLQVAWARLSMPLDTDNWAVLAFFELETPDVPVQLVVSWAQLWLAGLTLLDPPTLGHRRGTTTTTTGGRRRQ